MAAKRPENGVSIPPQLGNATTSGREIFDFFSGLPSIGREVHSYNLSWRYAHKGLKLASLKGTKDEHRVFQIELDAKEEADRLLMMSRVQAVRKFEQKHGIAILSPDEQRLIDILVEEDKKEDELLSSKVGKKLTVGERMYADSDANTRTGERSVQIELFSAGRQARYLMKEDAISGQKYFNIDEANLLTSIDSHKKELAEFLNTKVGENPDGSPRTRLNEVFDTYKDAALSLESDPMHLIREAARDFKKATRADDEYIAKANVSEARGALKDMLTRGIIFAPTFGYFALQRVIGEKNANNVMAVFERFDFSSLGHLNGADTVGAVLTILGVGLPVLLTLNGMVEAGVRRVTDTYQERIGRRKTKYRDAALEKGLDRLGLEEFHIPLPTKAKRRILPNWLHDRIHA